MTETSRFLAAVPAVTVSDERRAVRFLESALGFTELVHEGQGLGILRRDEVELHIGRRRVGGRGRKAPGGLCLMPDPGHRG
jgi:hypothetical protein